MNGPLGEYLERASGYGDGGAWAMFRQGAQQAGRLQASGLGVVHEYPEPEELPSRAECLRRNKRLISSLSDEPEADEIVRQIEVDRKLGRMTELHSIEELDLSDVLLARLFGVVQGTRADGSKKVRPCNDETANGCNSLCQPAEKLSNDGVDMFIEVIIALALATATVPMLWKADIDAAYRRILVRPEDRWLLWVAMKVGDKVLAAQHLATCFGSTASVHSWHRIGGFLAHVARALLKLPVLRYVDDFFGADRPQDTEHAMHCFKRIVRALMGPDAIKKEKLQFGNPLVVLGVSIKVTCDRVFAWPSEEKVEKWSLLLKKVRNDKVLGTGEAGRLAGRLAFAAQYVFMRLGRAMLRPFFAQQYSPLAGSRIGPLLALAIDWWLQALKLPLCSEVKIHEPEGTAVDLWCDARGTPPRVGAVLVDGSYIAYCDRRTGQGVLDIFVTREDEQIMGQELLAIVVALATFRPAIRNRTVRVWTDNAGGEGALRKGAACSPDHNKVVHGIWLLAAKANIGLHINRVGTHFNIGDDPSREVYHLLECLGAERWDTVLPKQVWRPDAWFDWSW